jgi:hypothetical protein
MTTSDIITGSVTAAPGVPPTGDGLAQQAAAVGSAPGRETQAGRGDRVTLGGKVQEAKKAPTPTKQTDEYVSRMGSVVFSYNFKGHLRIRFMDSANTLVYQIPTVMAARMEDLMMRADSSVNASV